MNDQLAALTRLHELLARERIEYWLFGGWAVDFQPASLAALKADKSEVRDDPRVAEKDRVDSSTLAGVEQR